MAAHLHRGPVSGACALRITTPPTANMTEFNMNTVANPNAAPMLPPNPIVLRTHISEIRYIAIFANEAMGVQALS